MLRLLVLTLLSKVMPIHHLPLDMHRPPVCNYHHVFTIRLFVSCSKSLKRALECSLHIKSWVFPMKGHGATANKKTFSLSLFLRQYLSPGLVTLVRLPRRRQYLKDSQESRSPVSSSHHRLHKRLRHDCLLHLLCKMRTVAIFRKVNGRSPAQRWENTVYLHICNAPPLLWGAV